SAMCVRMSRHIQVDFMYRYVPAKVARILATMVDLARIAFFAYGAVLIWRFMSIVGDEQMTTINLPKNLTYAFVFIGFLLMCFRSIQVAVANWRRGYPVLERPEASDAPVVAET
ncbi:MAG TPA: TRAP transporter small permease subunit, partial [Microvirga sp.]|nr:TRAP transporter small permease subunit [Microvirga sp.]